MSLSFVHFMEDNSFKCASCDTLSLLPSISNSPISLFTVPAAFSFMNTENSVMLIFACNKHAVTLCAVFVYLHISLSRVESDIQLSKSESNRVVQV